MNCLKPMTCDQFARHLLTLKDGDEFCFACSLGASAQEEHGRYDPYDAECWYFAKVMHLAEYDSRFILIDYCGGEEAFTIPLHSYPNGCDEDDMRIVPKYVETFFRKCPNLGDINSTIYVELSVLDVEMEEE